jgi:hypothetical protein
MGLKRKIGWIVLLTLAIAIKIISLFPAFVEKYYSLGFYPFISRIQRILLGWIPFSIGDIFYGVIALYCLVMFVRFIRSAFRKELTRRYFYKLVLDFVYAWLVVYVYFNLAWGLNYNRLGIADQLQIDVKTYSTEDLATLTDTIIHRLNGTYNASLETRNDMHRKRTLFNRAFEAYDATSKENSFLTYKTRSIKPSIYSYFGDYFGFTGYYNPFSGEAQVNTTVPLFVQPFTTCHEMGHQMGYAKENEANFAGFLSAKASSDSAFLYSLYFDLYSYCMRDLLRRDTVVGNSLKKELLPGVKKDFLELKNFYEKYSNPFEPLITKAYGEYLKANQQPVGMMTYNEVVGMIIAYTKKYGMQAL